MDEMPLLFGFWLFSVEFGQEDGQGRLLRCWMSFGN